MHEHVLLHILIWLNFVSLYFLFEYAILCPTHLIILRTITTTIIIIIIILLLWLLQLLMLPQPPFKPAYYTLVIIDLCKVLSSRLNIADFFSQSLRDCFFFTILYRLQFYLFLLYNFIKISVSLNVWCLLLSNLVAMQ
jgi:hypothetical protein